MANPAINMTVINIGADNDWDKYVAVKLSFPIKEDEIGIKTLISHGGSGRERRRSKPSTPRRTFKLDFPIIDTLEVDRIWSLYLDRKGAAYTFSWKRPARYDGDTAVIYNVRFLKDGMGRSWFNVNLHKTGLELQEVFTNEL